MPPAGRAQARDVDHAARRQAGLHAAAEVGRDEPEHEAYRQGDPVGWGLVQIRKKGLRDFAWVAPGGRA